MKKMLKRFPPDGKEHKVLLHELHQDGMINKNLANMIAFIIENRDTKYSVDKKGTLKILINEEV